MKTKNFAPAAFFGRKLTHASFPLVLGLVFQSAASAGVAISLTPLRASATPSQKVTFTATVTGTQQTAVTWSVPSAGTLISSVTSSGGTATYTTPAAIDISSSVTIVVTSVADPAQWAYAKLTLVPQATVSVTPTAFVLDAADSMRLTTAVGGTTNTAVTWSLQPNLGTIDNTGLYTAPPAVASTQNVVITARSVLDPAHYATATVTVNPVITLTMGPTGLTALAYKGQSMLLPGKGSPSFAQVKMIDSTGKLVGVSITPSSVVSDKVSTVTSTYPWGVVTTAYRATGNRLQVTVTIKNTTPDKTMDHIWMYPVGLQFPATPTNLARLPSAAFNLDAPTSIYWNYGTGAVDLVNEDVLKPLTTGFWAAQNPAGSQWFLMLNTDSGHTVTKNWPPTPRPIAPLASDQYTVSLRFGGSGATEQQLAGDILALYAATFPQQVAAPTFNKPIAALNATSRHRPTYSTNPRGWFNDPTVDVTTSSGVAAFHSRLLNWANNAITEMQRVGAQGGILWDLEGQQFDEAYIGDPSQAETIAPELAGVIDAFIARFTAAGMRIGFTLRPQVFRQQAGFLNVAGTKVTWAGGTQFSPAWITGPSISGSIVIGGNNYQIQSVESPISMTLATDAGTGIALPYIYASHVNPSDPGAALKAKIQYAKDRWGASLFYVDSNLTWDGTINPAACFQDLMNTFPDVLIFPEWENTRHYAYTIPYNNSLASIFSAPPDTLAVYPKAVTLIKVNDASAASSPRQLLDAASKGNILLFDGWYRHPANDLIQQIYSQVH